jgi:20S proteasome subunit beta 2
MLRNINLEVDRSNVRPPKERDYKFRRGTTAWTKEDVRKFVVEEEITTLLSTEEMDTS